MASVGTPITFVLGPLLDNAGDAITGATWTVAVARKPDGSSFSSGLSAYEDEGDGIYAVATVTDQAGVWFLYSRTTVNDVTYTDSSQLDVLPDTGMTPARGAKLDSLGPTFVKPG